VRSGLAALVAGVLAWPVTGWAIAPASAPSAKAASAPKGPKVAALLVDVNSASRAELKKLRGIGDAEADKIIAGRPYLSKSELVTKGALPAGVYQVIRHEIIAKQKNPAGAKN